MLERLTIERFKSIRSADIELGRVNLFIGANGTGKSNLLEAVGLVSSMLGRGISNADLSRKGIRLTPPELMKSAHKNRVLPKTLELSATISSGIQYRCNLSSSISDPALKVHSESCEFHGFKVFGRSARGNKVNGTSLPGQLDKARGMWDQIKAAYDFDSELLEEIGEFSRYAIFSPQTDFLRGRKYEAAEVPPIGLHGEGLPDAVSELIRQSHRRRRSSRDVIPAAVIASEALRLVYLPGWTRGVRVGKLEKYMISSDVRNDTEKMVYFLDRYMRDERNKLSAYDSSEGTLFLLFAAVLLAHEAAPKYFAFDNVDSALNPVMTRVLVESIIKMVGRVQEAGWDVGPKQVFLTSHNPTSLDAFDLFDDDQRAFVVTREKSSGDTKITRLHPRKGMSKADWAIATGGKKLSQMWLDGMISGLSLQDEF